MKRLMLAGLLGAAASLGAMATTAAAAPPELTGTGTGSFLGQTLASSSSHHTYYYESAGQYELTGALNGSATETGENTVTEAGTDSWDYSGTISVQTSCGRISEGISDIGEGTYSAALFVGSGTITGHGSDPLTITYTQNSDHITYSARWSCTA